MTLTLQLLSDKYHIDCVNGVVCTSHNEQGYCFLPKNNWSNYQHKLEEISSPQYGFVKPFSDAITLVDVDPYIRKLFWEKIAPIFLGAAENNRKIAFKNYVDDTIKRLEKYSNIFTKELITHELIINPAGVQTTAYNHSKKFDVGLHIDTNNTPSLYDRRNGFHPLAINLGTQHRYFNFALHSVKGMLQCLGKNAEDFAYVRQLKDEFLSSFPDTHNFSPKSRARSSLYSSISKHYSRWGNK
jgi:hypothetical protein